MKRILFFMVYFFIAESVFGQIAHYNQFPAMQPQHILDDHLTNISFAFSMRVLNSDYEGYLVRLRKQNGQNPGNGDEEKDFGWSENDIVDVVAIDAWRKKKDVYVVTWYDQSGEGNNATQTDEDRQPQFYSDATIPYFQGDGTNNTGDFLEVVTSNGIQSVTNNGNEGSVLGVMKATKRAQHSFGVLRGSNRWSTHINWSDNNLYFDPGICCNNVRSFENSSNVNVWQQYTFIKTNSNAIARAGGDEKFNGLHTTGRCTRTENFAIGWATGTGWNKYATTSFSELIMYKMDISADEYLEIEEDAITFWNL
ncbi:hypothetical protein ACFQ5N_11675 [Lutibacter holmesii]|uniref:Alpha-L-arabinofuranosidase B catalytic domain-containing protein n=1 Tax=Lutibacter holmesii TaxID=1137985 RepID=A0ABW3WRI0_9FLAO